MSLDYVYKISDPTNKQMIFEKSGTESRQNSFWTVLDRSKLWQILISLMAESRLDHKREIVEN